MTFRRVLLVIAAGFAVVLAALAAGLFFAAHSASARAAAAESAASVQAEQEPTATPEPQPQVSTIRFSASGDDLIHAGIYMQAARRAAAANEGKAYDFSGCYANLSDFYTQFDVNWINQETLINDVCPPSSYPCFSTPGQLAWDLYDLGFRAFSLSNNHTYDQGATGLAATRELWDSMPDDVVTSGLYRLDSYDNLAYQTVNDITIAYLSYTEHTNGIPTPSGAEYGVVYLNQSDVIAQQMSAVRANADFVVVSCHWGIEGSHQINDTQRNYAQQLADLGADLIIGTHPHVVQDAEWLIGSGGNQTFVVYSLGNLISMQDSADNLIGTILDITLQKTVQPDGTAQTALLSPVLHPVVTHYDWGYANDRLYLLSDYTEELAQKHGAHEYNSVFTLDYLKQVVQNNISAEYLMQ